MPLPPPPPLGWLTPLELASICATCYALLDIDQETALWRLHNTVRTRVRNITFIKVNMRAKTLGHLQIMSYEGDHFNKMTFKGGIG